MSNRPNLPSTSLDANKKATHEMREQHHAKILKAIGQLKLATYEQIGAKTGLDKIAIARRLCELERTGIIHKPGLKANTTSGRQAFLYQLTNQPALTVTQQVDALINNATEPFIQQSLFP